VKTATEDPACGGTTTTTTLPPDTCQGNPDGGPDQVVLTVGPSGSDLDNGWTGSSHNFIVVPNGKIGLCVTGGCNDAGQTTCNVTGPVGPGTISGETFGAPLPLFASNVPVCVISKWNGPLSGTIDQATGETTLNVHLFSQVYLTSRDDVCPQCKNGKCNAAAGSNAGKNCTVDATVPVYVSSTQTDNSDLSTTCVYSSPPTRPLGIDFVPLTSERRVRSRARRPARRSRASRPACRRCPTSAMRPDAARRAPAWPASRRSTIRPTLGPTSAWTRRAA
jgi:hypothetical protein